MGFERQSLNYTNAALFVDLLLNKDFDEIFVRLQEEFPRKPELIAEYKMLKGIK